ncbi:MAG: ABC transporter permease subunit, partial [Dehalococcoidia bacterium]
MRGARTDFLSTAPVAAAGAALVLLVVAAWPIAALARAIAASDLINLVQADSDVRAAFAWSVWQAAAASAFGVIFGLASAYSWARLQYPGRTLLRGLAVAPIAIPSVVLASGVQALFSEGTPASDLVSIVGFNPIRFQQGTGAVIVAHSLMATASVGWIASVAWASVDARKVDAARTLGAGRLRAARVAVWPAVWPAAAAGAGLAFLQATLSYGVVAILAEDHETPEGLAVRLAITGDSRAYTVAALTCVYSILCGLIIIQFLRRPVDDPQRTRPRQRPRGLDRVAASVSAVPAAVIVGATTALLLRSIDSG